MATHSSTLAWKIPWTKEPGGLQSMGSLRVEHDWATSLSLFPFLHWRRKWQPIPVVLAWRIPGTGEPCGLPSMGSHRVGHDWSDLAAAAVTSKFEYSCILSLHSFGRLSIHDFHSFTNLSLFFSFWREKKNFPIIVCSASVKAIITPFFFSWCINKNKTNIKIAIFDPEK